MYKTCIKTVYYYMLKIWNDKISVIIDLMYLKFEYIIHYSVAMLTILDGNNTNN